VSFGIQDFNPDIHEAINRFQSFEITEECVKAARKTGYTSVNFDLVYGLPFQGIESIRDTIEKVTALWPDRIAFYSYAHVPWLRPGQRRYSEKDLPQDSEKRKLYESGREMFLKAGYKDVGMDHFALPTDELYKAYMNKTLHRNFMGYTSSFTGMLIGLGCSAISDTWNCFSQNIKTVEEYIAIVNEGNFPITKGHLLNHEDLRLRRHILNLMCRNETPLDNDSQVIERLDSLVIDGLVEIGNDKVRVTEKGRQFIRNICLAYDKHYWKKQPENKMFSSTA
jgi:oxygen-independent coproporphyrinogen-3 oxidase